MKRVTEDMKVEFRRLAGTMTAREIGALFGVADTTVYRHINKRCADKFREAERRSKAKRRENPEIREKDRQYWREFTAERRNKKRQENSLR